MGEIGTSFQNYPPWNLGGLGWGSQNVEAPNPKLPTKWFFNVFLMKTFKNHCVAIILQTIL
jgi:hypothetical protein